jgi:hypothetical protein
LEWKWKWRNWFQSMSSLAFTNIYLKWNGREFHENVKNWFLNIPEFDYQGVWMISISDIYNNPKLPITLEYIHQGFSNKDVLTI